MTVIEGTPVTHRGRIPAGVMDERINSVVRIAERDGLTTIAQIVEELGLTYTQASKALDRATERHLLIFHMDGRVKVWVPALQQGQVDLNEQHLLGSTLTVTAIRLDIPELGPYLEVRNERDGSKLTLRVA